jgi:hypothetical protein
MFAILQAFCEISKTRIREKRVKIRQSGGNAGVLKFLWNGDFSCLVIPLFLYNMSPDLVFRAWNHEYPHNPQCRGRCRR